MINTIEDGTKMLNRGLKLLAIQKEMDDLYFQLCDDVSDDEEYKYYRKISEGINDLIHFYHGK